MPVQDVLVVFPWVRFRPSSDLKTSQKHAHMHAVRIALTITHEVAAWISHDRGIEFTHRFQDVFPETLVVRQRTGFIQPTVYTSTHMLGKA